MKRPIAILAAAATVAGLATVVAQPVAATAGCRVDHAVTGQWQGGWSCDGILDEVETAGRVEDSGNSLLFSWPGVYFEGRFRGTGVGIVLSDPAAYYDVQVDGTTVRTLAMPAAGTHWVTGLAAGEHTIRLVKRSESPYSTSSFGGFVAAPGGAILPKPRARNRQIEFIGDSYTAGYGDLSTSRTCTPDQINQTTETDIAFGPLTARALGADYQVNAFSGRGMVRNYDGGSPGTSYRTYYDRALLADAGDVWRKPPSWDPQLVVIGLGINDFSTPLNPGEQWPTQASLIAAYKSAYESFIAKLRARYGNNTIIVVSATYLSNTTAFADSAQQVVQDLNGQGDNRVVYWYYPDTGLDHLGCDWHPSAHDHRIISQELTSFIATLPVRW